jgi:RNA polymerase sigma factor (sigma-70 family)
LSISLVNTVERARRGDATAFEELYRLHAGGVYAVAARMCRDDTQAKDVTQEVFIRLWQKIGSFRGDSEFTTWFRRLTINVCLNAIAATGGDSNAVLSVTTRRCSSVASACGGRDRLGASHIQASYERAAVFRSP